jgi:hypothetical protein
MRHFINGSKVLGIAFLLQFITSFVNGVIIRPAVIVPGNIEATLQQITANPTLLQIYILLDLITALGIIFLGAMLFITVRKENEKAALVGLGFYILEAALLAVSRTSAVSLLTSSQAYAAAGDPATWLAMGQVTLEFVSFAGSMAMLAFCLGAILFYYLLYRSRVVPAWLSLWGLIAVFPVLVATLMVSFGYEFPMLLALPYVPFEFAIGVWILIKGVPEETGGTREAVQAKPQVVGT